MTRRRRAILVLFIILVLAAAGIVLLPLPRCDAIPRSMVSCMITDRNGRLLREYLSDDEGTSCWAPMDHIPDSLVRATITAEDRRFYSHHGIDYVALGRACIQNLGARRVVSGASTITQQLAELMFRLPHGTAGTKAKKLFYALKLEKRYSKRQILELYLNRLPYGNQAFGIEAASRLYFDRSAAQLSWAQAAFLAAIPQSPSLYDPYRHLQEALVRQKAILKAMRSEGMIDQDRFREALEEPIVLADRSRKFNAPHFCDFLYSTLKSQNLREASIIHSTVDLSLQKEIEILLKERIRKLEEKGVTNGAAVVMENETGAVRAMVGSVDFWGSEGQTNAALAKRQPGSTLKPFTYGLALERGYKASDIIPDLKTSIPDENGDFTPQNYDRSFHGPVRFRQALACSYNIPAVRILQDLGPQFLYERLKLAGFESLDRRPDYYGVGLTLGSGEVTLRELVRAYSIFARQGDYINDCIIESAFDSRGNALPVTQKAGRTRIFSPQIAFIIGNMLADREARIPAFGRNSVLNFPFQCAVKTGTSKAFRDNWTVGCTPRYTVGVWVGNFNGTEMRNVSGVTGAGPLFHEIMMTVSRKYRRDTFPWPEGIVEKRICPLSGELTTVSCPASMNEYFLKGREPSASCEVHRLSSASGRKVYEVYPPLYAEWMDEHGMRPPHDEQAPPSRKEEQRRRAMDPGKVQEPLVLFPREGDIFHIDPILRKKYQVIHMKAVVPEGTAKIRWVLDGKPIGTSAYPYLFEWELQQGTHSLQVAIDRGTYSRSVQFFVR